MSLNLSWSLKPWQGSQRQLHGRRSSGKEHHEDRCASREPTGAGEGPIRFPQFLFPALSGRIVTGYFYDRGHEDIIIKSKVSTFHFANELYSEWLRPKESFQACALEGSATDSTGSLACPSWVIWQTLELQGSRSRREMQSLLLPARLPPPPFFPELTFPTQQNHSVLQSRAQREPLFLEISRPSFFWKQRLQDQMPRVALLRAPRGRTGSLPVLCQAL